MSLGWYRSCRFLYRFQVVPSGGIMSETSIPSVVARARALCQQGDKVGARKCFQEALAAAGTGSPDGFELRIQQARLLHRAPWPDPADWVELLADMAADPGVRFADLEDLYLEATGDLLALLTPLSEAALTSLETVVEILRKSERFRNSLADPMCAARLARLRLVRGDAARVAPLLEQCLTRLDSALGSHHPEVVLAAAAVAEARHVLKFSTAAAQLLQLRLRAGEVGMLPMAVTLVRILRDLDRRDEAVSVCREAYEGIAAAVDSRWVVELLMHAGQLWGAAPSADLMRANQMAGRCLDLRSRLAQQVGDICLKTGAYVLEPAANLAEAQARYNAALAVLRHGRMKEGGQALVWAIAREFSQWLEREGRDPQAPLVRVAETLRHYQPDKLSDPRVHHPGSPVDASSCGVRISSNPDAVRLGSHSRKSN
jgi:hypothetical protein